MNAFEIKNLARNYDRSRGVIDMSLDIQEEARII